MKNFSMSGSFILKLLTMLMLLGLQHPCPSSLAHASEIIPSGTENCVVAEYQPIKKKRGIGRMINWGLAKLENIYDGDLVSDLITAFIAKCDHIFATMIHSFKDMTLTYNELHESEVERLGQFDKEFKDLAKLRNKIDRKCLYSSTMDDRSLCIEKGIEINEKITTLRSQRSKSADSIERYKEMIIWCASYKNWFC
mmetsp:Transcript_34561/g.83610  ORF Transcript_34561/g.83610 Transcript_34561/m.83610 type:complete len:196 (+) Transcript_34561:201-788(+)|eukprot:CAMPEP_0181079268 /NCGR_PEP_ID=MMETSP1071-20121207/1940_1 /TAXON_ID=35127 /ORGANISM="Thalassiosira sp., Strain NH16" /LENGTH=195 /DNA_ID=CAMNT_0023160661 /DNA_START=132 /DNA_END=719 /DNA_ORIENTATION=-